MTTPLRRPIRGTAALAVVMLAAVAGCGGGGATADPAASPSSGSSDPAADATVMTIVAQGIAFVPDQLGAPAGSALAITFDNRDAGVPHNLALFGDAGFSTKLAETEVASGPVIQRLAVPGLVPGEYRFTCIVHPTMTTTMVVRP